MANPIKRCCQCQCAVCGAVSQQHFLIGEVPEIDQAFRVFCKNCNEETEHFLSLTKKRKVELKRIAEEAALREEIEQICRDNGFSCRFLYQSVIITTPLSDWAFDYHRTKKTLYHESTVKINFATGNYAKSHVQFREKKMTNSEVIRYIASHDTAKTKRCIDQKSCK